MKINKLLLSLLLTASLFSCSKGNKESSKISVIATTFPCYDAARAILGETMQNGTIELKLLVKPGTEVHSFDPSPADIISIQKSNLFIYVGGESDEWVEKIINSNDSSSINELKLIDFVQTIDEVEFDESEEDSNHSEENSENHTQIDNPHEQDEHIWTSPSNEIKIIDAVYNSLCKVAINTNKTELCTIFEKNMNKYKEDISVVVSKTANIISNSNEKFIIMADRFPFIYFANYYELDFDAAFSGCSTAVEASTATISRLIDSVKEKNLPAVFYIELGNHKIADSIAEACNVKSLLLQSCQNVTKKDFDKGETWVSLMNKNADILAEGLR